MYATESIPLEDSKPDVKRSHPHVPPSYVLLFKIFGRPLGDAAVLKVAHALEHRLDFASQIPERVKAGRC